MHLTTPEGTSEHTVLTEGAEVGEAEEKEHVCSVDSDGAFDSFRVLVYKPAWILNLKVWYTVIG